MSCAAPLPEAPGAAHQRRIMAPGDILILALGGAFGAYSYMLFARGTGKRKR